jgi:acyl-coenzyme A thioesterase PaaI-like protein
MKKSLQETYAAHSTCFGCGPSNNKGLRIRSFAGENEVTAEWMPEPHHEAFPGMLNGGIIGSLLDCHSNWTAAWYLMQEKKEDHPQCTVTAEYAVKLLRPTPSKQKLKLVAKLVEIKSDRAIISAELWSGEKLCDTCLGTFVAVKPGHPAYHRW